MVRNPLLGTGFESFWLGPRLETMWAQYWWHPQEAHNGYIEVFLSLGWTGVAFLALVIATGYRKVFKSWRSNAQVGSLMLAYFFIGLVYNYTEAAFFKMQAVAWMFFLFAIVRVPSIARRTSRRSTANLFQQTEDMTTGQAVPGELIRSQRV
jgi:O-antigen ligase